MVASLTHRGPDKADAWTEANVGLGHCMLWTTPESLQEELPLTDKSGYLAITADARLDNRNELIASLGLGGRPREEVSDSELILGAYEKWDEECPEKLLGDFAFAVWDRRKQRVFCARDHFGIKPFYYYRSESVLALASDIKALLCVPQIPRRLNEVRVADCLALNIDDKTTTFYQDIFRLPPAHTMSVSRQGVVMRPYWSLDASRELRLGSDDEYAEAFRELFTEAVLCRLRSAFPVGSELSGGLDSSSVACVARDLLAERRNRRLHTFSAVFDDMPKSDEQVFIDSVLSQQGPLESHKVRADELSPLVDLEQVLWHMDEPNILSMNLDWGLHNAAHQQDVRILLTGQDGDTVVQKGEFYVLELARTGRWGKMAIEIDGLSKQFGRPRRKVFFSVMQPLLPSSVAQIWRMLRGGTAPLWPPSTAYINPVFLRDVGLEARTLHRSDPPESTPLARAAHWRGLVSGGESYRFEGTARVGGAFAIEPRHPFYDRRLVEFCLALPPEQKLSRGFNRAILRRAMANILPEEVRRRTSKGNLSHHYIQSLRAFDRRLLEEVVLNNPQVVERYVNMAALRHMYHRLVSGDVLPKEAAILANTAKLAVWLGSTGLKP
jgi:asparagine synthase (glutamine-hydrolysing)